MLLVTSYIPYGIHVPIPFTNGGYHFTKHIYMLLLTSESVNMTQGRRKHRSSYKYIHKLRDEINRPPSLLCSKFILCIMEINLISMFHNLWYTVVVAEPRTKDRWNHRLEIVSLLCPAVVKRRQYKLLFHRRRLKLNSEFNSQLRSRSITIFSKRRFNFQKKQIILFEQFRTSQFHNNC
jgi:hypothetical protein